MVRKLAKWIKHMQVDTPTAKIITRITTKTNVYSVLKMCANILCVFFLWDELV